MLYNPTMIIATKKEKKKNRIPESQMYILFQQ